MSKATLIKVAFFINVSKEIVFYSVQKQITNFALLLIEIDAT